MGVLDVTPERVMMRVLLVEDDPGDALLVRAYLAEDPDQPYELSHVRRLKEALDLAVTARFDVVMTDLGLPDSQGLATVDALVAAFPDVPVVVLTGLDDRGIGNAAVQRGCQDYLVKGTGNADLLQRTLGHAIERAQAARSLKESEARFRNLVEVCPDAILVLSDGRLMFANQAALTSFGAKDLDSLLDVELGRLLGSAANALFPNWPNLSVVNGQVGHESHLECVVARLGGGNFNAEVVTCPIPYRGRPAIQIMFRDITERKKAENEYRLAAAVFSTTYEAILVTDEQNLIVAANPSFARVTGYTAEEVVGRNPKLLSSGRHDKEFYKTLWDALLSVGHWRGELWNRRKSGEVYVQRATISLVRDASGAVVNHVAVFSDITDAKQEEELIRFRASYDALTSLPNRTLLYDRLQLALAKTARERGRLGLLFLDLDGFKEINDRYGHLAGDRLLVEVARRLRRCVRESDTVARLGGDEFIILLTDMVTPADAQLIASKILRALCHPFPLEKSRVTIGASVGISVYPDHGQTPEALLDAADRAMYAAKEMGKGRFATAGHDFARL